MSSQVGIFPSVCVCTTPCLSHYFTLKLHIILCVSINYVSFSYTCHRNFRFYAQIYLDDLLMQMRYCGAARCILSLVSIFFTVNELRSYGPIFMFSVETCSTPSTGAQDTIANRLASLAGTPIATTSTPEANSTQSPNTAVSSTKAAVIPGVNNQTLPQSAGLLYLSIVNFFFITSFLLLTRTSIIQGTAGATTARVCKWTTASAYRLSLSSYKTSKPS